MFEFVRLASCASLGGTLCLRLPLGLRLRLRLFTFPLAFTIMEKTTLEQLSDELAIN